MTTTYHGGQTIGFNVSTQGSDSFTAIDPATNQPLPDRFHDATLEEVDQAAQLAARAFPAYSSKSPQERAAFLDAIADEIEKIGDALTARGKAETALPEMRLNFERGRTTGQLRLFATVLREGSWVDAVIDHAQPDRQPMPKPDVRRMLMPIGPVAIFAASNFPLAFSVAGGDTASALAAGNPVVVKAHPAHPGVSELTAKAINAAAEATGMPEGVFSLLHGRGHDVGTALVQHPAIEAVGFTGSLRGGRALFDAAADRPKPIPVHAEMGSTNPVFILPNALAGAGEKLAGGLVQSVVLGAGQFCTNPGIVVAIKGEPLDTFMQMVAQQIEAVDTQTMLYAGICSAYHEGLRRVEQAGGRRVAASKDVPSNGGGSNGQPTQTGAAVFTVDAAAFIGEPELQEELFGPATLIVACDSPDQMRQVAASLPGQLTGTICGDANDFGQFLDVIGLVRARVGRLIFNGMPTGVEVCAAMHHGGPYPATTDARCTSVGTAAIVRFTRPICYQDCPQPLLPPELQDANPLKIWRRVDNELNRDGA